MERPSVERCLAYAVLSDCSAWLGGPSLKDLDLLLIGAMTRAQLLSVEIPEWRIFGPLEQPEFYLPIVARTGHPTLSINSTTALGLLHFNMEDGVAELRRLLEDWAHSDAQPTALPLLPPWPESPPPDLLSFLRTLARRPGMYLGSTRGWALRCFLHGMARGGDWLSLPTLPALDDVIGGIEAQSMKCYGSPFAAYRVYDHSVLPILAWGGVEPE